MRFTSKLLLIHFIKHYSIYVFNMNRQGRIGRGGYNGCDWTRRLGGKKLAKKKKSTTFFLDLYPIKWGRQKIVTTERYKPKHRPANSLKKWGS